jgi:hypothetical protein
LDTPYFPFRERFRTAHVATAAAALPTAVVLVCACVEAWRDSGSIAAAGSHGWLPYAMLTALVVATLLAAGGAARPPRTTVWALLLLTALAVWAAISSAWSPVPSLARDEGLLTAFYVLSLAAPLLSLRTPQQRIVALEVAVAILGAFALLVAAKLALAHDAAGLFVGRRLYFPITYANAQGSFFALGFWPAILIAIRRGARLAPRVFGVAAASTFLAAATVTQSKGTVVGLTASFLVVIAVSSARLRLVVPVAIAAVLDAIAFRPLTEPFRTLTNTTAHRAGLAVIAVGAAGAVAGAAYVLLDRRIDLGPRARRIAAVATGVAAAAAIVVAVGAFLLSVDSPRQWADARWQSFKHLPSRTNASTHFVDLGSNRYDFWRVSIHLFEHHPVAGCGARCFGPEYRIRARSSERPVRAHSIAFEIAAEDGVVGIALLGGALALLLALLVRVTRLRNAPATAGLGAAVAWLAQACVDWTWTFPAVTAPAFAVVGVALARGHGFLPLARARAAAAVVFAATVLALFPTWLSARLTERAARGETPNTAATLRWAERLDPLSTAPLVVRAQLARSAPEQLTALRKAARMEPRVLATQYFLGVLYLNLGEKAKARAQLERTLRLDPSNPSVLHALALAR